MIKVGTRFGMELGALPGIKLVSIIAGEKGWKKDVCRRRRRRS